MARALRIKYKNALYHITSRGNERSNIFENDHDRDFFIKILIESLNTYHKKNRGRFSVLQHPTDSINYWKKRDQPVKTRLLYQGGFDYE